MSGSSPVIPSVLALLNCQKIPQVFHLILKPFDPPLVIRPNRFLDPIESVVNRVEPLHHRIKAAIHIVLLRHLAKSALDHPGPCFNCDLSLRHIFKITVLQQPSIASNRGWRPVCCGNLAALFRNGPFL